MRPIEWIIRQVKYSSLKNSENLDYIMIKKHAMLSLLLQVQHSYGCIASPERSIQSNPWGAILRWVSTWNFWVTESLAMVNCRFWVEMIALRSDCEVIRLRISRRKSHECLCQGGVFESKWRDVCANPWLLGWWSVKNLEKTGVNVLKNQHLRN